MSIKVIGAGFGRNGTLSLKLALEQLGFARCYHMLEIREHPDHVKIWCDAARGEPVDWDSLFEGYQASVDWPSCTFWREQSSAVGGSAADFVRIDEPALEGLPEAIAVPGEGSAACRGRTERRRGCRDAQHQERRNEDAGQDGAGEAQRGLLEVARQGGRQDAARLHQQLAHVAACPAATRACASCGVIRAACLSSCCAENSAPSATITLPR